MSGSEVTGASALADVFEGERDRLTALADRILGSRHDAEDAVQEAWIRLSRSDSDEVGNLGGWLTTVVSRICLDQLRARTVRRGIATDPEPVLHVVPAEPVVEPEAQAELADSVGTALQVVLDSLGPRERLAFVLHDLFDVRFAEVAQILEVSPAAARQLASRARQRVRGEDPGRTPAQAQHRHRAIVDAFIEASRGGDLARLLELLAPDAVLSADAVAAAMGADRHVVGGAAIAAIYNGRARAARPAMIDGEPGAVWSLRGEPKVLFTFTVTDGLISGIRLVADPDALAAFAAASAR